MRLALIYTTFPKDSETFLQREARAFLARQEEGVEVEFFSLWGGRGEFEGHKVRKLGIAGIGWAVVKGLGMLFWKPQVWALLWPPRPTRSLGLWENWLGLAGGVAWAGRLGKFDWVHAQWGGAPAMTALAASKIAPTRYSMGLHAYDLWENGGDAWMEEKVARATAVFSSNDQAHTEVKRRFPAKEALRVRRGLAQKQLAKPGPKAVREVPLLLGIGRLVEKKGFEDFIAVVATLKGHGVEVEAEIIGEGPMRAVLEAQIKREGLEACVRLAGWKNEAQVRERLREANLLLFTGRVAKNGDRDGFPNTLAEAFAAGAVVVACDVAGVAEGVSNGKTGILMPSMDCGAWAKKIEALLGEPAHCEQLRQGAHAWVVENFNAEKNAGVSLKCFDRFAQGLLNDV